MQLEKVGARLAGRRPYPAAPLHRDSRVVENRDTGDGY